MNKNIIIILLGGLFLAQCTSSNQEEPVQTAKVGGNTADSNPFQRSPKQALEVVEEALSSSSELRGVVSSREIDRLVDFAQRSEFRATQQLSDFAKNFYAVEFKNDQGYAIVSKDLRTFPIYAILDSGRADSKELNSQEMRLQTEKMLAGFHHEIELYNKAEEESKEALRGNSGDASTNRENNIAEFQQDGWAISRHATPRLETSWGQHVIKELKLVMNPDGASYRDIHERLDEEAYTIHPIWSFPLASPPKSFGCTPVAFAQVMYALRHEKGFNTLKYTSGEPVLWDRMSTSRYTTSLECQRFMGWITMNCSPHSFGDQTMVFNITATKFLRRLMGDNIKSRYDNCVVSEGDFDGYGWSEDSRIAEEFFTYPKCFVIMTASAGLLDYVSYHTFVIDGMVEFKKRMKGSGFLGTGLFRKWRNGVRHLYHVNPGWSGKSNGYYLYVQSVNDEFKYRGDNNAMDYRSKVAYLIVRPS